jgi:hypothetical protein
MPLRHANQTSFRKGAKPGPGRPKGSGEPPVGNWDIKDKCAELLPLAFAECEKILRSPLKSREPLKVRITEMISDRLHGRPSQAITASLQGPLAASFTELMANVDGSKGERFR